MCSSFLRIPSVKSGQESTEGLCRFNHNADSWIRMPHTANLNKLTQMSSRPGGAGSACKGKGMENLKKRKLSDDTNNAGDISQDPGSPAYFKQAPKSGQDASSLSDALIKHKTSNLTIINDKTELKSRTNPAKSKKTVRDFRETKNKLDAPKMSKTTKNKSASPVRESSEHKVCPKAKPSSAKAHPNALHQVCHNLKKVESASQEVVNLPVGLEDGTALKARTRKPISRFTDTTMRYKRSYLSSMPVTKRKANLYLCSSEKTKKVSKKTGEEDSYQDAAAKTSGNQKPGNKYQTNIEVQVEKRKAPTDDDKASSTSKAKKSKMSVSPEVRGKCPSKYVQRNVKRPKLKPSNSKSFGFWRGSRLRRMASLNAQAKVHILYENDARSSSPEERCDEDGGNLQDKKVSPSDVPALDKRSSSVSAGSKQAPKHSSVKPDDKKVTEKHSINRWKTSKVVAKKHKVNKKPRATDVPAMVVMPKRMASLNAQAILAASYSSERYRMKPVKSPAAIKTADAVQSAVPEHFAEVAQTTITTSNDTVQQVIDAVASGKLKFYRRIMKASVLKNKANIFKTKPEKGTKVISRPPEGSDAASIQKGSAKVAKWRKDITGKLGAGANKRRKLLADVVVVASDDAVIIESPKMREILANDGPEKPKERKEGFYQDECDPEKDDLDKSLDIAKVVITTTELQPATGGGADKISVKAEAIRRDKIEDTAEVTITGMYINPVTNTSQSFCISRIHTYKQASSTLSYSPQALGGPTGVHVGGIVGSQQPVVGGPTTASATVISPQPQAQPQPQAPTIPPHHVTGAGSLHPGHPNPSTAHLHGGTATLCPYSSAAAAQPCSIGGMPLVDVALSRHYGSAFTVPHYGHHYAHGYYPSSGPLMQTMATDPCLIHKPVPFHPHSFQAEHCQSHPPSGATQSMQPFPTADQCHTHPPTPYPPPGPGPGGPQQPQPSQQHYPQNVDAAPPNVSPLASVGGLQCGMPSQPSLDKCTPQPPKPSNVPNAAPSCFNDASCQSCAAAAAAAAVAVAVATEQYSTAAQHYSLVSTKPSVPPSASAPPPPSSPAVSATPRQFSARSRTRMPATIMGTASPSDPYGRLPPTKPDVGRQNALPIQTQTDHAQDVPPLFAPKMVKVETVDSCSDGSESERQREKEPGTLKDFGYTPATSHHHMETRRLKWRGYTPSGTPPLQDMVIKSISHGMSREEKGSSVAIRNLRNKRQNLAAMAASRKSGNAYTKRQLRHKDVTVALSPEESFKKSVVNSWLRSPKQQHHRGKVEAMRKNLLAEDLPPLVTTAVANSFSTRRRKLDDSQQLTLIGKSNSGKGILGETNKELVIRTRRLDIASFKECNGKLRMRDVTNERLHSEYSRGRSYRPLNHQTSHASSHSSSNSSSTIQALPPHKGCNGQHPDHHPVTTRRNSSSSAASTASSGLSSSKSTSHYTNDKVPRPFLRSKGGRKLLRYSNGWTWDGQPFQQAVYIHNDDPPIIRKCFPAMRHIQGDIIKVRDCVLLKSGPRKSDLPYVAKVTALWENSDDGEMMFSLLWYYRPEHTEQGRKCHHMEDEIFASKHQDMNSVACIEDKCYVLTTNEYCRYRCRSRMLEEGLRPKPSVVPDLDEGYPRKDRQPPGRISPEMIFVCRKVYEFRQKRILKNPT